MARENKFAEKTFKVLSHISSCLYCSGALHHHTIWSQKGYCIGWPYFSTCNFTTNFNYYPQSIPCKKLVLIKMIERTLSLEKQCTSIVYIRNCVFKMLFHVSTWCYGMESKHALLQVLGVCKWCDEGHCTHTPMANYTPCFAFCFIASNLQHNTLRFDAVRSSQWKLKAPYCPVVEKLQWGKWQLFTHS